MKEKKQNSAKKEQKSTLCKKMANVATSEFQCRDIRVPMSRHCVVKVLTLLQCRDIAATSVEEGKEKICQYHDIIMTLLQHQTNVVTS